MTGARRLALGLLAASLPGLGAAQVLDDVFPSGVPGYGATPGVTVLSRLHPDYASRGITEGALTILPGLTIGAGYDSEPNGVAPASAAGTLAPSLRIADPLLGLGAYASGTVNRYPHNPAQNTSDITTGIGLALPFGPDSVTLGAAHLLVDETALGIGTEAVTTPIRAGVNDFRARGAFADGMITLTPGFGVTSENFAGTVPGSAAAPLSAQDRVVLAQSLGLTAAPPGTLDYTVLLRIEEADYTSEPAGAPSQNSATAELLAGIATDTGGLWHARMLAGFARQGFADRASPSRITPVIELGIGWMPDALTALDLTVTRRVDLTAAAGALASTLTTADLALAEEYQRNLVLTAEASAQASHGRGGADQQVYDARTGFIWHLSRELSLAGYYRFEATSGTLVRAAHDNLIHLALEWTP